MPEANFLQNNIAAQCEGSFTDRENLYVDVNEGRSWQKKSCIFSEKTVKIVSGQFYRGGGDCAGKAGVYVSAPEIITKGKRFCVDEEQEISAGLMASYLSLKEINIKFTNMNMEDVLLSGEQISLTDNPDNSMHRPLI
jgi:hypothetical protein